MSSAVASATKSSPSLPCLPSHHHHHEPRTNSDCNGVPAAESKPLSNTQLKRLRVKEWRRMQRTNGGQRDSSRNKNETNHVNSHDLKSLAASKLVKVNSSTEPTKAIAIDCEMVGCGPRGCRDSVARVSLVNAFGHVLYDKYVQPLEKVTDFRTFVSGIYPHHLESASPFEEVQREVCSLLKDRILVGHAVDHDLRVLYLQHPRKDIRDTVKYFKASDYGGKGAPSLKKLTQHHIGIDIQGSEHDSVEDARAAMRLYTLFKKQWESEMNQKFKHQ